MAASDMQHATGQRRPRAPVVILDHHRDLRAECEALAQAIARGTASTEQTARYRAAIHRLCAPHTPGAVITMHLHCAAFRAAVRAGEAVTAADEAAFMRFERVVRRTGVPLLAEACAAQPARTVPSTAARAEA